jgi:hypothetical protein
MKAKEGDTVTSVLNGIHYKIRKIQNRVAVLESQDGKCQILTELDTLMAFYQKKEDLERSNRT